MEQLNIDRISQALSMLARGETFDNIMKKCRITLSTLNEIRDANPLFAGATFLHRLRHWVD